MLHAPQNTARRGLSERDRSISVLGEADIIEHPIHLMPYRSEVRHHGARAHASLRSAVMSRSDAAPQVFASDLDVRAFRLGTQHAAFRRLQRKAMRLYLQGRWAEARAAFAQLPRVAPGLALVATSAAVGNGRINVRELLVPLAEAASADDAVVAARLDSASAAVWGFMSRHGWHAPAEWSGRRSVVVP